jgi:hypothetical protein
MGSMSLNTPHPRGRARALLPRRERAPSLRSGLRRATACRAREDKRRGQGKWRSSKEEESTTTNFQLRGAKFRGPTGCTTEREARAFERQKREEAKKESDRRQALGRGAPLTWAEVASRYWREHGQFHKPDTGTLQALTWLTRGIGEKTLIAHINGDVVGRLVAKRRADGVLRLSIGR